MPDPKGHDQPAEGGEETVNKALEKQERASQKSKTSEPAKQKPNKQDKPNR